MRILVLLILLFTLSGCKLESDHAREAEIIKQKAEAFCSCRGGVLELSISQWNSISDSGFVHCKNGSYSSRVEEITITCEKSL